MKMQIEPLEFTPVYKSYLWGGSRIAANYAREGAPGVCAESWEISGHADGMSVVKSGAYAGQTLAALAETFGRALVGEASPTEKTFPLLFKLIDARERLSVQVHPSDATAAKFGGEAKSEMWYLLGEDGQLFAGLKPGVTEAGFRTALAEGKVAQLLATYDVREGDALYIPGGLVHAIGEGCLVYEVQQCSNTTYRLYDWDRTGPDGKPRALHIDEGLRVVDWAAGVPEIMRGGKAGALPRWDEVVASPYFRMRRLALENDNEKITVSGESFHVLFIEKGRATVRAGNVVLSAATGQSLLLPACAETYEVVADGRAELLVTTLK